MTWRRVLVALWLVAGALVAPSLAAAQGPGADPRPPARAAERVFEAIVVRVPDGDTIWVRPPGWAADAKPLKLRLQGIDAPERCQAWGREARQALAARVMRRSVVVDVRGRDDHDRLLARVRHDDEDLGAWLVSQGHAWSYGRGRSGGPYARQQEAAQSARRGLFADPGAVRPRDFRREHGPCD